MATQTAQEPLFSDAETETENDSDDEDIISKSHSFLISLDSWLNQKEGGNVAMSYELHYKIQEKLQSVSIGRGESFF